MKHFRTISEFHEFLGLPKPQHPLFSLIDIETVAHSYQNNAVNMMFDFFSISVKKMHNVKVRYGQHPFDFNDGMMSFMAPQQVFNIGLNDDNKEVEKSGWVIYIHPDFIWNTPLAKTIRQYDFWDYSLYENLYLSEKEKIVILEIIKNINLEYHSNIDRYSKSIIISQIETLLNYGDRFYNRQFITREKINHQILERLEKWLSNHFNDQNLSSNGIPSVELIASSLNISPKYLSSILKTLTGQNTQQHIHEKLIEKAKEQLSTTDLTVSEIAYGLGFEHLQSFSKLFKTKTGQSPLTFRRSFN